MLTSLYSGGGVIVSIVFQAFHNEHKVYGDCHKNFKQTFDIAL